MKFLFWKKKKIRNIVFVSVILIFLAWPSNIWWLGIYLRYFLREIFIELFFKKLVNVYLIIFKENKSTFIQFISLMRLFFWFRTVLYFFFFVQHIIQKSIKYNK